MNNPENFIISDLHMGHENILTFKKPNTDEPLRPFKTMDEMHDTIISNWNKTVRPKDRVFVLGDAVWNPEGLDLMQLMNGIKILVKGNHDHKLTIYKYMEVFNDIHGAFVKHGVSGKKIIMTHVPIHPQSLNTRFDFNVHGHLHSEYITQHNNMSPDLRYINVSCEQLNYTPAHLRDLIYTRSQLIDVIKLEVDNYHARTLTNEPPSLGSN